MSPEEPGRPRGRPAWPEPVARVQAAGEVSDSLAAWGALEDLWPRVAAAVEGPDLAYETFDGLIHAIDRMDIVPVDKPVAGVAVGVGITWRLRYAACEEEAV